MPDDSELQAHHPFDALDGEAARLDAFFSGLSGDEWDRPSRCEGWTVRDVLAHLASGEEYHRACLDGTVSELMSRWAEWGATDLHTANQMAVDDRADRTPEEVLEEWRSANAENRRRFRERGDGTVDTSIGDYPCRWQAFHVASELATHGDDVGVPVPGDEAERRRSWRAALSRFALAEVKPDLEIEAVDGRTKVSDGDTKVEVTDDTLIDGVAGRLDESSGLEPEVRAMLSAMP